MKAVLPSGILSQEVVCLAHIQKAPDSLRTYAMYTTNGETKRVVISNEDVYLHFGDTIQVQVAAGAFDGGVETDGVFVNGVHVAACQEGVSGYQSVGYTYVVAAYEVSVKFRGTHHTDNYDFYACNIVES